MIKYLRYQNLWIGILISISSFFLFDFLRWEEYDMRSFIDGSKLLFGDETALNLQSRITKPLPLILPGLLHLLLNFDIKQTILFQNCILLLISLITILKIETYYKSNNLMPLIVLSGPFAIFALFIQSDIWGWFFQFFTLYIIIDQHRKEVLFQTKSLIFIQSIFIVAFLAKESILINIVYYIILLLLNVKTLINNKLKAFTVSFTSITITVLFQYIIQSKFNTNAIDRSFVANDNFTQFNFSIDYLKQLYRTIDGFWLIMIPSVIICLKKHIKYKLVLASLYTALVFLFIAPFFKFYIQDRILFMLIPILIPVYMLGTKNIPKAVCWAIGILNIATAYLIYKHDFNILYINFIISLIICIYIFRHPILHFRRIKKT